MVFHMCAATSDTGLDWLMKKAKGSQANRERNMYIGISIAVAIPAERRAGRIMTTLIS